MKTKLFKTIGVTVMLGLGLLVSRQFNHNARGGDTNAMTNLPGSTTLEYRPMQGSAPKSVAIINTNQDIEIDYDTNGVASLHKLPTEPTITKREAEAQAATAKNAADAQSQRSFQAGFAAGVRAAEQARLEEQLPGLTQRAAQVWQQQSGGGK